MPAKVETQLNLAKSIGKNAVRTGFVANVRPLMAIVRTISTATWILLKTAAKTATTSDIKSSIKTVKKLFALPLAIISFIMTIPMKLTTGTIIRTPSVDESEKDPVDSIIVGSQVFMLSFIIP